MSPYARIRQHGARLEGQLQAAIWQSCLSGQRDWHLVTKLESERSDALQLQLTFDGDLTS